jgi:hypothetical protein
MDSTRTIAAALLALALTPSPAASGPSTWNSPLEVAAGRGERGPWQQNDSRYDFVDDPSVALSEDGQAAVAWVDQARKAVLFQRYSAQGKPLMPAPVDVSRQPQTFSWLPRVVLDPADARRVFVLWQEIIFSGGSHGGEIMLARSVDGGRTFAPPLNLSKSVPGDGKGRISRDLWHNGSFDLAAGPGGLLVATWTEYDGPLWVSRSTDGGRSFSVPRRLAGAAGDPPARAPALALAPGGAVYLAWTVGEVASADIHLSRSDDGGQSFGPPARVAPSPGYSDAPKLAVDAAGTLHLVHAEAAGGPSGPSRIRYLRSRDGGRNFDPPRELSDPLPDSSTGASYPSLAVRGESLAVAWEMATRQGHGTRGLALVLSPDGGRSFTQPAAVPGSADPGGGANGSSQGQLMRKLALNGRGELALVNSALKAGSHSRVWLLRGRWPP